MIILGSDEIQMTELSFSVIEVMKGIEQFGNFDLEDLASIDIGLLRSDSTRKHAVCRYKKGISKKDLSLIHI